MNSKTWFCLLGLGAGLVIMAGCNKTPVPSSPTGAGPAGGADGTGGSRTSSVTVAPVTKATMQSILTYSGSLAPRSQVSIAPRATGRIEKLLVDVGDSVKAGDVLAQLEKTTAQIQVQTAEASVRSAQARIDQLTPVDADIKAAQASVAASLSSSTKADNDLAKLRAGPNLDLVRQAQLDLEQRKASRWQSQISRDASCGRVQDATCLSADAAVMATEIAVTLSNDKLNVLLAGPKPEDIVNSQKAADSARMALASAQARLDQLLAGPKSADLAAAQASLDQSRASLETARMALEDTVLVAPFDGIVASRSLSVGGTASGQAAIVTLISKDLDIAISVEESKIGMLRKDLPVTLTVSAFPGQIFAGKVSAVSPIADSKTHTFVVRIAPDNSSGKMSAGMFADVKILAEQHAGALTIPKDAIVRQGDRQVVFVAKNGQAALRVVQTGLSDDKNYEIVSGIIAEDQIIISGQNGLADGSRIVITGQNTQTGGTPGGPTGDSTQQQGRPTPPPGGQSGGQSGGQGARPGATTTTGTPTAGRN
ncbi:MAG: efflux RND transporter periplasmic adaptor subunit [Dehalococcoidia bacterium]|nr:efflux RND transporter periplasmic adaptor subunit [Dehalococcoidia bacterium]